MQVPSPPPPVHLTQDYARTLPPYSGPSLSSPNPSSLTPTSLHFSSPTIPQLRPRHQVQPSSHFLFFLQAPRRLRLPRLPFFTKWKKDNPSPQNSPPPPPQIKGLPLHRRNPPQPPRPLPLPPLPIHPSPKEGPPLSRLETTPITTPVHSSRYL